MPRRNLIVLTGGGTAGHVMPNLALLPELRQQGWEILYIGSAGMEGDLVRAAGLDFKKIQSGKLRRYFSLENFFDVFKVAAGFVQALGILLINRPRLIFSKGGFVSVPVCLAGWCLRIPVLTHESDVTPGLANRIIGRFADKILYSFPQSGKHLAPGKSEFVGSLMRAELFAGDARRGRSFCGFAPEMPGPLLLIMGGSLGAQSLNDALLKILPQLVERFLIVHLTGRGKSLGFAHPRYRAFEFLGSELPDILAMTDLVLSRAGANSIFEFLSLRKPMLLVPLVAGSRGDQVVNADSFAAEGWAQVLGEAQLSPAALLQALDKLHRDAAAVKAAQGSYQPNGTEKALVLIRKFFKY